MLTFLKAILLSSMHFALITGAAERTEGPVHGWEWRKLCLTIGRHARLRRRKDLEDALPVPVGHENADEGKRNGHDSQWK